MKKNNIFIIPTNSNGPEFLPELENHPFPVLGRNFSPRARFPIQARFLVLQKNSGGNSRDSGGNSQESGKKKRGASF